MKLPSVRIFLAAATVFFSLTASGFLHADAIDSIASNMVRGARDLKRKKLAVLPFPYHDGRSSQGPSYIAKKLIEEMTKKKKVDVIERGQIENVLRELTLQSAGLVDQDIIRQIGRILGVEAVVSGILIDEDEDTVEINARLIRADTGEVLERASGKIRKSWPVPKTGKEIQAARKVAADQQAEEKAAAEAADREAEKAAERLALADTAAKPAESKSEPSKEAAPDNAAKAPPEPAEPIALNLENEAVHLESERPEPEPLESLQAEQKPSARGQDIVLDTRGEGRLLSEDYLLLESNFPLEITQNPENSQLLDGFRTLRSGDANRAIGIFSLLEKRYRKQPKLKAVTQLGTSLSNFALGRKSQAINEAESVAGDDENPSLSAAAHYVLARYSETFGRAKAAREHYKEVLRISPFQTRLVKASSDRLTRSEALEAQQKSRRRRR